MVPISKDLENFLIRRKQYLHTKNPNYEEVYYYANCDVKDERMLPTSVGELTDLLIYLKLDPLKSNTMTYIPSYFMFHSEQEEIEIPEGVDRIYQWGMAYAAIETLTIPKSVIQIDEEAFYRCENLKEIIYLGTMDEWNDLIMHDNAFKGCPNITFIRTSDDEIKVN